MELVNHSFIKINFDFMHCVREGFSVKEAFNLLKSWISHVHIHDGTFDNGLTFKPIGEGKVDHKSALKLLKSISYDGYLSGEWINWEPYEKHLPRELDKLKEYEN